MAYNKWFLRHRYWFPLSYWFLFFGLQFETKSSLPESKSLYGYLKASTLLFKGRKNRLWQGDAATLTGANLSRLAQGSLLLHHLNRRSRNLRSRLIKQMLDDLQDIEARVLQLKDIEHRGDDMTHNILTKLNQTFITPFDREDIYRLASSLDDVLDFVYAAGVRLTMYKITSAPVAASKLSEIVVKQSDQLTAVLARLGKKPDNGLEHCVRINRLEH